MAMPTFADPQALAAWLEARQINTDAWGQDNAKSVVDLWHEIQQAESTLHDEAPLRRVQVVELDVRAENRQLIEAAQLFASGQVRHRNHPPSEKMLPGEDPFATARRCLAEELGIAEAARIHFPPQTVEPRVTIVDSTSYPGLLTQFTFYTVCVHVANLPTTEFTTPNAAHAHGDPVVAHRWQWRTGS
ncbi:MAG: hypothetical protein KF832_22010 [Caldilineaceae bacterium]|nr:hypothetical protein [Caldilineaceae bacterium]